MKILIKELSELRAAVRMRGMMADGNLFTQNIHVYIDPINSDFEDKALLEKFFPHCWHAGSSLKVDDVWLAFRNKIDTPLSRNATYSIDFYELAACASSRDVASSELFDYDILITNTKADLNHEALMSLRQFIPQEYKMAIIPRHLKYSSIYHEMEGVDVLSKSGILFEACNCAKLVLAGNLFSTDDSEHNPYEMCVNAFGYVNKNFCKRDAYSWMYKNSPLLQGVNSWDDVCVNDLARKLEAPKPIELLLEKENAVALNRERLLRKISEDLSIQNI